MQHTTYKKNDHSHEHEHEQQHGHEHEQQHGHEHEKRHEHKREYMVQRVKKCHSGNPELTEAGTESTAQACWSRACMIYSLSIGMPPCTASQVWSRKFAASA
jgi:hypothetical protein